MTISKAIATNIIAPNLASTIDSPQNTISLKNKAQLIPTVKSLNNELSNANNAIKSYVSNGMNSKNSSATLMMTLNKTSNVMQKFLDNQSTSKSNPANFLSQAGPANDAAKGALKSLLFHVLVDMASKQLMQRLDALVKNMAIAALHHGIAQLGNAQMSKPPAKNMGIEGLNENVDFKGMLKGFKKFGINGKTADGKRVKLRVNEKDVKKYGSMEAALQHKMNKAGISNLSELKNVKLIGKRTDGMQTHWMKPKDLNEISAGKKNWGDVRRKGFFEKVGGFFKGIGKGIANIGKGIWNGIKGIGKGIVSVGKSIGKAVVGVAKGVGNIFKTGASFLGKVFKGDFKGAGKVIKDGAKKTWNNIKGAAIGLKDGVVNVAKGAWNIAKGVGKGVVNMHKGMFEGVGKLFRGDIGGAFNSVADGYKNQWSEMSKGFKTGLGQMVNGVSSITSAPISAVAGKEAGDAVGDVTKRIGNFGAGFVTGGIDGMAKVTAGTADIANGRGSIEDNAAKMAEGAFDVAMAATGAGGAMKGVTGLKNLGSMGKAGKASHAGGNGFVSGAKTQMNVLDDIALAAKQSKQGKMGKIKDKIIPGADKSHTTQSLVLNKSSKLVLDIARTPTDQTDNNQLSTRAVQWT